MRYFLRCIRYFICRYIIFRQFWASKLYYNCELIPICNAVNSFFGYYNLSPINKSEQIIYLVVDEEKKWPIDGAAIYLNDRNERRCIGSTNAWNWQQGCMLQWLPPDNTKILFNDYDKIVDSYVARVIDDRGNLLFNLPTAVSSVSAQGDYALSLNFKRLAQLRPAYGYFSHKDKNLPDIENDGIYFIDLRLRTIKLLLSLKEIIDLRYVPSMNGAVHKVNHLDISPNGNRFMFLHRWIGNNGRFTRLITANRDGGDLCILNGDVMTSHCCWYNDSEIISFCNITGKGEGFFKLRDKTGEATLVSDKLHRKDGHPVVSLNKRFMIFDTYPNKGRLSSLYVYDFDTDQVYIIASLYQPLAYLGDNRIDLHPKLSPDGKILFIESGHDSKRKLYKMNIDRLLAELSNRT